MLIRSYKRPIGWRARTLPPRGSRFTPASPRSTHRRVAELVARHTTRRRLALICLASVFLHVLPVALILFWPRTESTKPAADLPSSVAMVFEPQVEGRRAAPTPSRTEIPALPKPNVEPADGAAIAKSPPLPLPRPSPIKPPDTSIREPNTPPPRLRPPSPKAHPSFPIPQA